MSSELGMSDIGVMGCQHDGAAVERLWHFELFKGTTAKRAWLLLLTSGFSVIRSSSCALLLPHWAAWRP